MKPYVSIVVTVVLSLSFFRGLSQEYNDSPEIRGMKSISSHELLGYVKEMASEKYGGRLTGTPGYDSSAQWLIRHLKGWGVEGKAPSGGYLQHFDIPYTRVFPGCRVTLHLPQNGGEILKHYDYVSEFIPGATSDSGTVQAEVVYAGYGITAPELGYDDYQGIDVEGKILLMEREVPLNPKDDTTLFKKWEPYSHHSYKLKNAVRHGAAGMLYNYGPIVNPNNAFEPGFIYSHVGDTVVQDIFAGTGRSHQQVTDSIRDNLQPVSFPTGKTFTITNNTQHFPNGRGSNVIGYMEGSDPRLKDEVIIIGAHLDHLGRCWELIPGANDNASGVAVMMAVARALSEYNIQMKRSVMFLSFGAEEQGIVGSRVYLQNPSFPLEKTWALLNLDGVGVGNKIGVTAGKNFPRRYTFFRDVNEQYIHRHLNPSSFLNITRPRLDAARFMKAGVPILSFYAYGAPSIYHQPGDDVDRITPEIMEEMARMLFMSVIRMANH
ncbi:MAG: M28 family peptidase [Bacteroidales bacterium]|nr:M28 family peptidase [Bacteroidales bacterium]